MPRKDFLENLKSILLINGIILIISLIFLFFGFYNVPFGFFIGILVLVLNKLILFYESIFEKKYCFSPWKSLFSTFAYLLTGLLVIFVSFLGLYLNHIGVNLFSWISVLIAYFIGEISLVIKEKFFKGDNL